MRQLWSGGDANDSLLREIFLQRLPSNVRMVLATISTGISLDNLAETADRIMEVSPPTTPWLLYRYLPLYHLSLLSENPSGLMSAVFRAWCNHCHFVQPTLAAIAPLHHHANALLVLLTHTHHLPMTQLSVGIISALGIQPPSADHSVG